MHVYQAPAEANDNLFELFWLIHMANTYDIHQWYKAVNAIKAIANLPKDTNQGRNGDYIKQI